MNIEHIVNLLEIANNDLQSVERRYQKIQRNVNDLESRSLDASITLEDLKSQIRTANQILDSCRLSCQEEVKKMLQLHRQNIRLNSLLGQLKNSDEVYLKIRYAAKQAVSGVLSDSRQLLKFAILSLTESLRTDPTKFNFLIHGMPPPLTMSKSTRINYAGSNRGYDTNPFPYSPNHGGYDETLAEILVNEAAILYKKMVKDFTNQAITNVADSSTNVIASMIYLDEQADHIQASLTYRHGWRIPNPKEAF